MPGLGVRGSIVQGSKFTFWKITTSNNHSYLSASTGLAKAALKD